MNRRRLGPHCSLETDREARRATMSIAEHPRTGTILVCDFDTGFREPEMVKRRPVVAISPRISARPGLCTVVPLSTRPPRFPADYHCELATLEPPLPPPWDKGPSWVKGDMIAAIGLRRLDFMRVGRDPDGKRRYRYDVLPARDIRRIRACVLAGLGLAGLTKHLP